MNPPLHDPNSVRKLYRAKFHPQAWQNDYAVYVDAEGETEWDITPEYLAKLQERYKDDPDEVLEQSTYASDELRYDPAAPKWMAEWDGPFYVETWEV